jgi:hypothetical protein
VSNLSDFMPKPLPGLSIPASTDDLLWSRARATKHLEATDTASGAEVYPQFYLRTDRNVAGAGGLIGWGGFNSTPTLVIFAQINAGITTLTAGAEGSKIVLNVLKAGATKTVSVSGDSAAVIPGVSADFTLGIDANRWGGVYIGNAAGTVKGDFILNGSTVEFGANTLHPLNLKTNNLIRVAIDTVGNVAHKKAIADQGYSKQVPTTGFAITIPDNCSSLLLDPAGTLATGTITMPAVPVDGQIVRLSSSQTVTALTLNANAGQTIAGAVSTLTAAAPASYQYALSVTKWFPIR